MYDFYDKMAFILQRKHIIYVSAGKTVFKLDMDTDTILSSSLSDEFNSETSITALAVSPSGKRLALATSNKTVALLDSCDLKVQGKLPAVRAISQVIFSKEEDVLLADKTGDVYLYELFSKEPQTKLLLGHLSVVLDVKQSDCGKYIMTCDRDEKIRISCFPNCYNIESYCLGHKEFISKIETFDKFVVSGSGDGTLRLWDFVKGKQLDVVNVNGFPGSRDALEGFRAKMEADKVEVSALPVTDLQVFKINEDVWCCASVFNFKGLLLYKVVNNTTPKLNFVMNVMANMNVINYSLGELLIVLTENGFSVFKYASDFSEIRLGSLSKLYEEHSSLFSSIKTRYDIESLYKRKFDNVQEYLERKKIRISQ